MRCPVLLIVHTGIVLCDWQLSTDCVGAAQVWVANGHSMVLLNVNSDRPQTLHVGGHILRISYDHATDQIFWIDSESHSINVYVSMWYV